MSPERRFSRLCVNLCEPHTACPHELSLLTPHVGGNLIFSNLACQSGVLTVSAGFRKRSVWRSSAGSVWIAESLSQERTVGGRRGAQNTGCWRNRPEVRIVKNQPSHSLRRPVRREGYRAALQSFGLHDGKTSMFWGSRSCWNVHIRLGSHQTRPLLHF